MNGIITNGQPRIDPKEAIDKHWAKVCMETGNQTWRWKWDDSLQKPVRCVKQRMIAMKRRGKAWVWGGKEVILDAEVPKHFLEKWLARGSQGKSSFIGKWLTEKLGVNQKNLQELWDIAITATRIPARWITGRRVEASWNSYQWDRPELSSKDLATVAKAIDIIKMGEDIIIITGAGISVNAGISDFRSCDGLFKTQGKDTFELSSLRSVEGLKNHNYVMGCLARRSMRAKPTAFHHMLAYLAELPHRPLRRHYTQNIDSIETSFLLLHTPVPLTKGKDQLNIQLHGNLRTTKCSACAEIAELDPEQHIHGEDLKCWNCIKVNPERPNKRKRLNGYLRPNIVLYGGDVDLDATEKAKVIQWDKREGNGRSQAADTLLVVGTSASLSEIQNMVKDFAKSIRSRVGGGGRVVWIGLQQPPNVILGEFDEVIIMDCETIALYFFDGVDFSRLVK